MLQTAIGFMSVGAFPDSVAAPNEKRGSTFLITRGGWLWKSRKKGLSLSNGEQFTGS